MHFCPPPRVSTLGHDLALTKEKIGTGTLSHWKCQCFNRSCICIGPTPEIHTVLKLGRMAAHFAEHTGVCLQIIPSSHLGRSATVEKSSPQFGFHAEATTIVSCQDRQRAFGFKDVENGKPHQNLTALDVNDCKMQEAYYVVQFVIIGRKPHHWTSLRTVSPDLSRGFQKITCASASTP